MRKYYKQIILWSAIVLVVITSIFCFLPSPLKQFISIRINMFFTVPNFPVKIVHVGSFGCGSEERGVLFDLGYQYNITHIYINEYPYKKINFLKGRKFDRLSLCDTEITEIFPLKDSKIIDFCIVNTPVKDLLFLKECDQLKSLFISDTKINDLAPLRKLKSIKRIYFAGREHVKENIDLSPLSGLVNLESLRIRNSIVTDLSFLGSLKYLRGLTIRNCEVSNFSALAKLTNLDWLDLDNTNISDIKLLSGLKELESLHLDKNNINDLKPLAGLDCLERLYLSGNPIEDLTPLKNLKNLKWLYLNNTNVKDLSPLKELSLTNLEIQGTPAANLPLPEWTKSIHVEK